MGLKNLGTVAGIFFGTTSPDNQKILWYDENTNVLKYYNIQSSSWDPFSASAGQIKLNVSDSLGYLQDKLHSSLVVSSGQLRIESTLLTRISGSLQASNNLSDLTVVATARTNLSVYSIAQVDAFIGNRSYSEENYVVNGQNLTASINALDIAINHVEVTELGGLWTALGTRLYTSEYNIADAESITASLEKIDQAIGDRTYISSYYTIGSGDPVSTMCKKLDTAIGHLNHSYYQTIYTIAANEAVAISLRKLDAAIGSRSYSLNNNITDGESLGASMEKIDLAIGARQYDANNFIVDGESIALSLNKLDDALQLKIATFDIGDWNMDSTAFLQVSINPIYMTQVKAVFVMIRPDSGAGHFPLSHSLTGTPGGIVNIQGIYVQMSRLTSGYFDNSTFSATSYNRGYITVLYK